jgi:hypothetical protein
MPELESMGHWNQSKVSQGRATSVMGFDPYNMKSDEEVPLKVGRVKLQKPDTIGSSIFGFDPQQESSSDEDSKISTHTKHADDLCPLPVESSTEEVVVKRRSDQRFAAPGEPTCAICGRFGAYICDEKMTCAAWNASMSFCNSKLKLMHRQQQRQGPHLWRL